MKRTAMAAAVFSVMALVACGGDDDSSFSDYAGSGGAKNASDSPGGGGGGTSSGSSSGSGSSLGSSGTSGSAPAPTADGTPGTPTQNLPQAGQLTAGVWDDNLNFEFYKKYLSLSGDAASNGLPSFTLDERAAARTQLQRTAKTDLDLTFLLDTTGSMGDELRYLQAEIDSIAQSIAAKHPQMQPRFNLVVYRDQGDAYLTQSSKWGNAADLKKTLDAQSVGGGGDLPEAVGQGLQAAADLDWRPATNVARMAIWVADAPHHFGEEGLVKDAIVKAQGKDVHLYPVAASGTDDRAEFTMRTAAQMTGGRYVFLTNDSGVGGDHAEPHIPCYQVTRFDSAIVRMVEGELTGARVAPTEAEVVRSIGNPKDGSCAISSGTVAIY